MTTQHLDYIPALIKEPSRLVEFAHKEDMFKDVYIIFKRISKAMASAYRDGYGENVAMDATDSISGPTALCWCSDCEQNFLADYLSPGDNWATRKGIRIGANTVDVQAHEFRNSDVMLCPHCYKEAKLISVANLPRFGITNKHYISVPSVTKGVFAISQYELVEKIAFQKHLYGSTHLECYIVDNKRIYRYAQYQANCQTWVYIGEWRRNKHYIDRLGAPFFYNLELPSLDGTELENAKLWEYMAETYETNRFMPLAYIRLYQKHKNVENLVTNGFAKQLAARIYYECNSRYTVSNSQPKLRQINWKANKPHEMLGIEKHELKKLKEFETSDLFDWLSIKKDIDFKDFIKVKETYKVGASTICDIVNDGEPLFKTIKYLKKQEVFYRILLDYWNMATELEIDLLQAQNKYPRFLRAEHDRLAQICKYKSELNEVMDFQRMTKRCEGLIWQKDGICIFPAQHPDDLVKEGNTLGHCVKGKQYQLSHSCGKIILFIRHARRPERSWYTLNVDVHTKKIIQNHGYKNEQGKNGKKINKSKKMEKFLAEWIKEVFEPWKLPTENKKRKAKKAKKEEKAA